MPFSCIFPEKRNGNHFSYSTNQVFIYETKSSSMHLDISDNNENVI